MAGLFDKQADLYLDGRPNYPTEWYSKLAALTPHHTLAWDVGTGNGQAAIGVSSLLFLSLDFFFWFFHFLIDPQIFFMWVILKSNCLIWCTFLTGFDD